jgi:hypothetical protein
MQSHRGPALSRVCARYALPLSAPAHTLEGSYEARRQYRMSLVSRVCNPVKILVATGLRCVNDISWQGVLSTIMWQCQP